MKFWGVVLVLAIFCSGVYAVTPDVTTIERYKRPSVRDYLCLISEDEFVTVCYDRDVAVVPPVDRYAALYAHVDQHFSNVGRGEAPLVIYIHNYKRWLKRLAIFFPAGAAQMREGHALYWAYTYGAKGEDILVFETYLEPTDNIVIHELLHHYLDRVVQDGSLNNHAIVKQYAYHIETLFRHDLEKDF